MKLSERLNRLAEQIEKGETVADIGTDHGYLPIFLYKTGKSPKVIFADISEGSLDKARECCKELCPGEKFDFRRGDGLDILENGEVDAVIIAGMGGLLMADILEWDIEKTCSIKKFVFQPRNNAGYLRKWLLERNFIIKEESLVREGDFICEIITALSPKSVPSKKNNHVDRDTDNRRKDGRGFRRNIEIHQLEEQIKYEFPESLVKYSNDVTEEYLKLHLQKARFIKNKIEEGCSDSLEDHKDYQYMCVQEKHILHLLDKLNKGDVSNENTASGKDTE